MCIVCIIGAVTEGKLAGLCIQAEIFTMYLSYISDIMDLDWASKPYNGVSPSILGITQ